jgi:hypothetical protein
MRSSIIFSGIILIVISALSSCKHETGNDVYDMDFTFTVKDTASNNLLNPATKGYYNKDSIRLFTWKDGIKTEIYHHNLDAQRNFVIVQNEEGEYGIKVFAEEGEGDHSQTTTILIQWNLKNENNVDTVSTLIDKTYLEHGTYIIVDKITYNSAVVWDSQKNSYHSQWGKGFYVRFFEIVKGK